MRLGLLVCGHVHDRLLPFGGDYPQLFSSYLAPAGIHVQAFAAETGELPDSVTDCDAWMISPSRASVLDRLPWIDPLSDFLRSVLRAERPLVGICFGHQLLADVAGGRVERAAGGWGAGVQTYEVTEPRPWMIPPARRINLVASHEDQVVELPPDAQLLATASYCPNAVFALGARAIGMQPHPEMTTGMSRTLIEVRRDLLGRDIADRATASLGRALDQALVAKWLAGFLTADDRALP